LSIKFNIFTIKFLLFFIIYVLWYYRWQTQYKIRDLHCTSLAISSKMSFYTWLDPVNFEENIFSEIRDTFHSIGSSENPKLVMYKVMVINRYYRRIIIICNMCIGLYLLLIYKYIYFPNLPITTYKILYMVWGLPTLLNTSQ